MIGITRVYLTAAMGGQKACVDYCHKADQNPFIYGELSGPGTNNDLIGVTDALREGSSSMYDISDQFPVQYIHHHKGIANWRSIMH